MVIEKFKSFDWQFFETENFVRYVRPLDRKVSEEELNKQEEHLKDFCETFNIKLSNKITIYSVTDRSEMKVFAGRETNGYAFPDKFEVFSVYVYHPHEIVHILADNFLGEPNRLLGEGLAVLYGDGWHGKSVNFWMKKFISEKSHISIKDLCDDIKFGTEFDDLISYPESGAFVKFLIDVFGIDKFKELYSRVGWKKSFDETKKIFENTLSISFEDLEKRFVDRYSI